MRLRDKVVVPQLSTAAQSRVEARFVAAVREGEARRVPLLGSFRALAVGLAVAGVAIAVAINLKSALDSRAVVSTVAQSSVTQISTGDDTVTLRVGDATVTVAANSELAILRHHSGELNVALERGRVDCEVEPIPGRAPFFVAASDVRVRVVGTVFSVEHDPAAAPDLAVHVGVSRGRVAVSSASGEVMVAAGRAWNARDGVGALVAAAEPSETTDVEPGPGPALTDADGAASLGARDATSPPEPASTTRRSNDSKTTATTRKTDVKKPDRPGALPRPRRMSKPSATAPDLDKAMALEKTDPREAIRVYTRIATKNHRGVASFALYSRAYVEYVKLGDRAGALRTLGIFRRRFPRARESESALWLQIKTLCELDKHAPCRSAAHSYIRRYPDGRFAAAASQVIDDLE